MMTSILLCTDSSSFRISLVFKEEVCRSRRFVSNVDRVLNPPERTRPLVENQCLYQRQWDGQIQLPSTLLKKITVAHDLDSTRFCRSVVEQRLIFCRKITFC